MTLAIFDIDGTLVRGSTERRFWRYLAKRGRLGPRQVAAYVYFLARYWPVFGVEVGKKNKAYLAWLRSDDIRALAGEFVVSEVVPLLYEPAVQRLRQHLLRGDAVALLSGTLEPIAAALADYLGVAHLRATVCVERDGRYRAEVPEMHPFAASKVFAAADLAAELGQELRQAAAYGDSRHDLALLKAVGTAVAVQPDEQLAEAAAANDWEVIADEGGRRRPVPH
jgi:HAD superfamily hydrolase (TIGR01490 family)